MFDFNNLYRHDTITCFARKHECFTPHLTPLIKVFNDKSMNDQQRLFKNELHKRFRCLFYDTLYSWIIYSFKGHFHLPLLEFIYLFFYTFHSKINSSIFNNFSTNTSPNDLSYAPNN